MGCRQSTAFTPVEIDRDNKRQTHSRKQRDTTGKIIAKSGAVRQRPEVDENGNLTEEEIAKRRVCVSGLESLKVGDNFTLRYAYISQRGYDPNDPDKESRDAVCISPKFSGFESDSLFSLYNGHGNCGCVCANYAKKKIPAELSKLLRQERARMHKFQLGDHKKSTKFDPKNWPTLKVKAYENQCHRAFVACNDCIHEDPSVNDSCSGTSAVAVTLHGGRVTISNVGHSRAVFGQRNMDSAMELTQCAAIPLTNDHIPSRKDERDRVRTWGSRVMTLSQLHGDDVEHDHWEPGDSPRLWVQDGEYPGTEVTRSIGDKTADILCGVHAEPEIISKDLSPEDRYIVLAGEGVFRFLTNQNVIDICSRYNDPMEACRAVIDKSYGLWMQHGEIIEDITMICISVECEGILRSLDPERRIKLSERSTRKVSLQDLDISYVYSQSNLECNDTMEEEQIIP